MLAENLKFSLSNRFFFRQYSEQNNSSEEAGDELRSFSLNRSHQRLPIAAEAERAEANSSPDLGIESDQGRYDRLLFIVYTNLIKKRFLLTDFPAWKLMATTFTDHYCQLLNWQNL